MTDYALQGVNGQWRLVLHVPKEVEKISKVSKIEREEKIIYYTL